MTTKQEAHRLIQRIRILREQRQSGEAYQLVIILRDLIKTRHQA